MNPSLVIVESPAKAKTINQYLGNEYVVRSCVGHIRDLPTSGSGRVKKRSPNSDLPKVPENAEKYAKVIRSMGVNPYNKWEARYEILPGKEKIISELKTLAKKSPSVYLATDLDREGEAIAWNLAQILGKDKDYKRVVFTEITKDAIQNAFKKPRQVDDDRVQAQQARRYLDRVVGYMLSPLLWKKIARGLSAGRVQSVAVKIIVEREREIRKFVPREFWKLGLDVTAEDGSAFTLNLAKYKGKKFEPASREEIDKILAEIKDKDLTISDIKRSLQKSSPPPPFITSSLQQAASTRLGFSVKRTMMAAQRLYEAGHITYMRTDSTNISNVAMKQNREFIGGNYADRYLVPDARYYKTKSKKAQEAHEAIRPSNVKISAGSLTSNKNIGDSEKRLYELIRSRFIATQMADAVFRRTKIEAQVGDYEFQVSGRVVDFEGFMRVSPMSLPDQLDLSDKLSMGDKLEIKKISPQQNFTKPPARYNEASLVKEMESLGIGRPSTYAPIISTIQERGYVSLINKRFHAEKIADIVTQRLDDSFPNLLAYNFTASMEDNLDAIADKEAEWTKVLDEFYFDFIDKLEKADDTGGMKENTAVQTKLECQKCSRPMLIRNSSTGIFLGCSGYDDKQDPCKNTINLVSTTHTDNIIEDEDETPKEMPSEEKRFCPVCESPMNGYVISAESMLYICERNPDCEGTLLEKGDFSDRVPKADEIDCDRCGGVMEMKSGRFGKYYDCTNPECDNKRRVSSNGQIAPIRMPPVQTDIVCDKYPSSSYIIREGALGLFLAAPGFPKQRETRSPYVKELMAYRDSLDKKFHYLLEAPLEDGAGNPFQVRYSRKRRQNYVATTDANKKKILEQAYYVGNKWELGEPPA